MASNQHCHQIIPQLFAADLQPQRHAALLPQARQSMILETKSFVFVELFYESMSQYSVCANGQPRQHSSIYSSCRSYSALL